MRKASLLWAILWAMFCLFFAAEAISAQNKTTDFSGNWELNIAGSKLPERTRLEPLLMIVSQTAGELTVHTIGKRNQPQMPLQIAAGVVQTNGKRVAQPENIGVNNNGSSAGNDQIVTFPGSLTFNLAGDTVEIMGDTPLGTASSVLTLNAYFEPDGRLNLTRNNKTTAEAAESFTKINDTWELSADGRRLKVLRVLTTMPGGAAQTAELFFVKTDGADLSANLSSSGLSGANLSGSASLAEVNGTQSEKFANPRLDKSLTGVVPQKQLSAGVLNGKAVQLPQPLYPAAARSAKAVGAVNVQITVNESGVVIAAKAVSGHSLLRAAAVEAALNAKFAPVFVQGIPVRITGVLVYNFKR